MPSLEELFCSVDDFCQIFEPQWQRQCRGHNLQVRKRERSFISLAIGISTPTTWIKCKLSGRSISQTGELSCLTFRFIGWPPCSKRLRVQNMQFKSKAAYHRFVEWIPRTLVDYLRSCFGSCTGISFMDATSLKVYHNKRISQHKVSETIAARGRTSVDWFYGLKSHLVINDKGMLDRLRRKSFCQALST